MYIYINSSMSEWTIFLQHNKLKYSTINFNASRMCWEIKHQVNSLNCLKVLPLRTKYVYSSVHKVKIVHKVGIFYKMHDISALEWHISILIYGIIRYGYWLTADIIFMGQLYILFVYSHFLYTWSPKFRNSNLLKT